MVPDGLWERIEPLLPQHPRRFRNPGRKRVPDRQVLCGILFVLYTAIPWEFLPQELGFGSGMTCWRRLAQWHQAGVWQRLHELLLAELNAADKLDWSKAVIDGSHVRALKGGPKPARTRLRSGCSSLGSGTDGRAAALVPSSAHPLGDPRRHPRSLHEPGLLHHLLPPTRQMIILLGLLKLSRVGMFGHSLGGATAAQA